MTVGNRTISVTNEVWNEAKEVVKESTGMTMSRFIDLYLRSVLRAQKGSSLRENVAQSAEELLFSNDRLTAREKLEGSELITEAVRKKKKKK